jgi:hypothetical protein
MSVGSYLSEIIVMVIVKASGKGSRDGWISENLNEAHIYGQVLLSYWIAQRTWFHFVRGVC